jgi:thymidylate synthase ThyX
MVEYFTEEEIELLKPYFTNTDKDIFVLRNLPEVVKGALFSKYSRSTKSLRRLFLDEFLKDQKAGFKELVTFQKEQGIELETAIQKAEDFYNRILDGFGDDSIAELGGSHVACENISNIAAKFLENSRIGGSPLEKSTRYVFFDKKVNGKYLYYREPKIMNSRFADEFIETMDYLFETYSKLIEPIKSFVQEKSPIEEFNFLVNPFTGEEKKFTEIKDEKMIERAKKAYNSSVKAKACDILRYLLPAATLTNLGFFGNGRFFEYLIRKCYSQPLKEIQCIGKEMHHELNHEIYAFIRRAKFDEFISNTLNDLFEFVPKIVKEKKFSSNKRVELIDFEKNAEEKVLAAMLYPFSRHSMKELREIVSKMSENEKKQLIEAYLKRRRHRRDKPGRALETTYYHFDLLADFGAYRDLQRHRILTQERQELTVVHGFETPKELIEAGFKEEFEDCMKKSADLYFKIFEKFPREAQYVVPFAYKIRWHVNLNLREAYHLIELRSSKQGHPSYRKICHEMFYEIKKVHPLLVEFMKFVDLNDYPLGRFEAEVRKQHHRAALGLE